MHREEKGTGPGRQWRARKRRKKRGSARLSLQYSVVGGGGAIIRSSVSGRRSPVGSEVVGEGGFGVGTVDLVVPVTLWVKSSSRHVD